MVTFVMILCEHWLLNNFLWDTNEVIVGAEG
jgi:hypothetical protein